MWIPKSVIPLVVFGIVAVSCQHSVTAQDTDTATKQAKNTPAKIADKPAGDSEKQKALYNKLEMYLSGTKWTGNFLLDGKDGLIKERYEILSAKKSEFGDKWNLVARIKYGDHDATLPLPPLDIKFAGNTPVITVDGLFFPGFGTFDARVVIRRGKYAGTWQHDKVGGHLFGTIEKMSDEEIAAAKELLKKNKIEK